MLESVDTIELRIRYKVAVHTRDKLHTEGLERFANRYESRIADLISEFEHRGIPLPVLTDD